MTIHVNTASELVGGIRQHLLLHLELGGRQRRGGRGEVAALVDHDRCKRKHLHRNDDRLDQSWSLILSYQTRLYLLESSRIASPIIHFPGSR